jgi:histidinol-phosphate/aromatic aminotransferase/cobyric acid decarboxylase-like protein
MLCCQRQDSMMHHANGAGRLVERSGFAKPCYHGGAFFAAIGEDFADLGRRDVVINADVLDAWFPPAPAVLDALREHLPWLLRTSPPTHARGLIEAIARTRGVPAPCVLPGAGSSDLIFLAFRSWLGSTSRVLLLDPTYGEYRHVCSQVIGCRVDFFHLHRHDHYAVDLDRLESTLGEDFDLVVVVNPNNPTGQHIPRDRLADALGRLPEHTRCWVDEAYVDYAGADQSLERFAASRPNIIVCKSLSKVHALSGTRAAYLVAGETIISELTPLAPPWSVSLPAQVAAVHALQSSDYYAARYRETVLLRNSLVRGLKKITPRAEILGGVGNFVLCHLPDDGPDAAQIVQRCRSRDVFVRDVGTMGQSMGRHALRIAVKDEETQERLLRVLAWAVNH